MSSFIRKAMTISIGMVICFAAFSGGLVAAEPSDGKFYDGAKIRSPFILLDPKISSIGTEENPYGGIGIEGINGCHISLGKSLGSIFTKGKNGYALYVNGASIYASSSLLLNTRGTESHGVYGAVSGDFSLSLHKKHLNSFMIFKGELEIITKGKNSNGIYAQVNLNSIKFRHNGTFNIGKTRPYNIEEVKSIILLKDEVDILTLGKNSHGVSAEYSQTSDNQIQKAAYFDESSKIKINDISAVVIFEKEADIITKGDKSYGVFSSTFKNIDTNYSITGKIESEIKFKDKISVLTKGENSYGIYAYSNNQLDAYNNSCVEPNIITAKIILSDNANIVTKGNNSTGVLSNAFISNNSNTKNSIKSQEAESIVMFADNAKILTEGKYSPGISTNAEVIIKKEPSLSINNVLEASITDKEKVSVDKAIAKVILGDEALIKTLGSYSHGISVKSEVITTIEEVLTKSKKENNIKTSLALSEVKLGEKARIETSGYGASGIYISSGGSLDPSKTIERVSRAILGDAAKIATKGNKAHGIYASFFAENCLSKGTAEVILGDSSIIETQGNSSHGIYAKFNPPGKTINSTLKMNLGDNVLIRTKGQGAYGIYSYLKNTNNESNISFGENAIIKTLGKLAHGIVNYGSSITFGNNARIHVKGEGADAFRFYNLPDDTLAYNNITVISEKANMITNGYSSYLNITFTGKSRLYGDLMSLKEFSLINLNLEDKTKWEGGVPATNLGEISVTMSSDTIWIVNKDSGLKSLELGGGLFAFKLRDSFTEVHLNELGGGGKIKMNVDMSFKNSKGDFLEIDDGKGNYNLIIAHNNAGGAKELVLIQLNTPNEDLSFALKQEKVQIGAYKYILEKRDQKNFIEWLLKRIGIDKKVKKEIPITLVGMGEFAKAIDATLSDELLISKNGLWLTSFYKFQKFDASMLDISLNQHIGGELIGLNKNFSDNFRIGQFFGLNIGYQDIGEGSTGHISSLTTGTYAQYEYKGFLASGYVRAANYVHYIEIQGEGELLTTTVNTYGFSASLQLSQKISLFNTNGYLTPKVKGSYTYVKDSSCDIGGMPVRNLDVTGFTTWLGARLGADNNKGENSYGYYLEAGWIHDTNPSVTMVMVDEEEENKEITLGRNRFEIGIGFYALPLSISNFHVELKYAKGQSIEEPIKVNIGGSVYF